MHVVCEQVRGASLLCTRVLVLCFRASSASCTYQRSPTKINLYVRPVLRDLYTRRSDDTGSDLNANPKLGVRSHVFLSVP